MCRKLICLVCFSLVLGLVGNVSAATVRWTAGGPDDLWSKVLNWDASAGPTNADKVVVQMVPGPIVENPDAVAHRLVIGDQDLGGPLTVDGGTLTIVNWLILGWQPDGEGTIDMNSGTITVGGNLWIGRDGTGTLNMNGGTITVGGTFAIAHNFSTAVGHVNLKSGTITCPVFAMSAAGGVGTMDIRAGTLIIDGDALSAVRGYIDNGWISAYGGNGTVQLDYDVTNEGKTTVKATNLFNPNPADGSSVSAGVNQLQWTLPDPNLSGGIVTCDVYFGTNSDVEANPKVVIRQAVESVSVTLASLTTYYWALDLYDSSVSDVDPAMLSPIFTFNTWNQAPVVDAGEDVATWLTDGTVDIELTGTVSDDGTPEFYTVLWTVQSDPNAGDAVFTPAGADQEAVTVTLTALGQYVLTLEANDGELTGVDTITINVFNDSCETAKSLPNYEPFPGDLNGDCIVNDLDLAILQEDWLKCNALDCPDQGL